MKNMIRFAAFVSMLAMLSTTVQAQVALPFYDGFNYPVGQNLGAQPSWATLNTGDSLTIAAGNLSYPGFAASTGNKIAFDGAGTDAAKRFDTVYTGTVYFSFLVKVANLGSLAAAGGYFVGFYQSSASVTTGAPVYVRPDGAGIDFGIAGRLTTTISWSTLKSIDTTYLVVGAYQFVDGTTNDSVKLWINPAISTFGKAEPTPTLTAVNTLADLYSIGRYMIRQDAATLTPFIEMDELRVGTTWADVTPAKGATGVAGNKAGLAPRDFCLEQNYPNPFNPATMIRYQIPAGSFVTLTVFDVLGKKITSLVNEQKDAGTYDVKFNAGNLSSGMYFYRIQSGGFVSVKKMFLMK